MNELVNKAGLRSIEIEFSGRRIKVFKLGKRWNYSIKHGKETSINYCGAETLEIALMEAKSDILER